MASSSASAASPAAGTTASGAGRFRGALGKALLAGISTLLTFAVLEVAARAWERSRPAGRSGEQAAYSEFDPELGWRKKPSSVARYRRREFETEVRVNARGLRGPEAPYADSLRRDRILLLGDSFVEGYTVAEDEAVGERLRASLASSGCPVEVVNGGTHGYSTDQELLFYRSEGRRYGAGTVVLFVYYNDILLNIRPRYFSTDKPVFADGSFDAPANTPLVDPGPRPPIVPRGPNVPTLWGSTLLAVLAERIYTGAPRTYERLASYGLVDPVEHETIGDELRVYRVRGGPEIDRAFAQTSGLIDRFARDVEADGGKLVIVHVPARFEVSERDWELTLVRYGLNADVWDRRRVATAIESAAKAAGASFFDPTDALRATSGAFREPYFVYDGHWNELGHSVVGESLASFLRGTGGIHC